MHQKTFLSVAGTTISGKQKSNDTEHISYECVMAQARKLHSFPFVLGMYALSACRSLSEQYYNGAKRTQKETRKQCVLLNKVCDANAKTIGIEAIRLSLSFFLLQKTAVLHAQSLICYKN